MKKEWIKKLKGKGRFVWFAIAIQGIQVVARLLWNAADWVGRISDLQTILAVLRDYSIPILKSIFSLPGAVLTFIVGFLYLR